MKRAIARQRLPRQAILSLWGAISHWRPAYRISSIGTVSSPIALFRNARRNAFGNLARGITGVAIQIAFGEDEFHSCRSGTHRHDGARHLAALGTRIDL